MCIFYFRAVWGTLLMPCLSIWNVCFRHICVQVLLINCCLSSVQLCLSISHCFVFQGAKVAATSAKEANKGARWCDTRSLSGPSGPPATGSPQTPHGCQASSFIQTELSHREGRQHRDLHPWSPDTALRSTYSSSASLVHLLLTPAQGVTSTLFFCQPLSLLVHFSTCYHSLGCPC